ncbi:MAG: acyl carrier protein [Acidimicrobiales bacterium]|nr:acyl carrier protein [Acidimicrobiales bacterium]
MKAESRTPLDHDQATTIVLQAISAVAPDVEDELPDLDHTIDFFEEFELDSMDHANVMTRLWETTGISIPEREYPSMRSVNTLAAYLEAESTSAGKDNE